MTPFYYVYTIPLLTLPIIIIIPICMYVYIGRDAVKQISTRHALIGYYGLDHIIRDAMERQGLGADEHRQNVLQEVMMNDDEDEIDRIG